MARKPSFAYFGLSLLMGAAAVSATSSNTRPEPTLFRIINGQLRPFLLGGSHLIWTASNPQISSAEATPTATATPTQPSALVAAEVTEVTSKEEETITVQYYQENNSKAPSTSLAPGAHPWPPAPTSVNTAAPTAKAPPQDPVAQKWVDLHNRAREPFGAGKLEWREDLVAKAKANAILCTGDHTNVGENIAALSGWLSPEQTVKWWMAEEVFYIWDNPIFEDKTGHFTQAVWKNVRHVGCYTNECAPGTVFDKSFGVSYQATCEYDPVGNFVNDGEFAKNVGKRQSGNAPWTP